MKYLLTLIILSSCASFQVPNLMPAPESGLQGSLDATAALVRDGGRVYCAGVFYRDYVLTAAHCILEDSPDEVHVAYRHEVERGKSVTEHTFHVIYADVPTDFAILAPGFPGHNPPARAILADEEPRVGSRAVTVGHPRGLTYSWHLGQVTAFRVMPVLGMSRWMQISAHVAPGNSGGPVLNRYGEIIGIVSFRSEAHLGGAVPLDTIVEALE